MATDSDWFPGMEAEQLVVVENIDDKIDNYKTELNIGADDVTEIRLLCAAYIEAVTKNEQLQATAKTLTNWKNQIKTGAPKGEPAPAPPAFLAITMPPGATLGVVDQLRDWARRWKDAKGYTTAIGDDLMITGTGGGDAPISQLQPTLKYQTVGNYTTEFQFSRQGMNGLRLEWRFAGGEAWQTADTFTASPATHTIVPTVPNQPVTIEYRARLVEKNQQIGIWSPIYTVFVTP